MTINIKVTKAEITPSIKSYINKNMAKLDKFLRSENNIHVELQHEPKHKSGLVCRAEVTVTPGALFYADARGNDFFEAIDLCMPKIKEQLLRNKDRKISQRRRLGAERKGTA